MLIMYVIPVYSVVSNSIKQFIEKENTVSSCKYLYIILTVMLVYYNELFITPPSI